MLILIYILVTSVLLHALNVKLHQLHVLVALMIITCLEEVVLPKRNVKLTTWRKNWMLLVIECACAQLLKIYICFINHVLRVVQPLDLFKIVVIQVKKYVVDAHHHVQSV